MGRKIGYLGPSGTFSELAAQQYLAHQMAGGDVEMVALPSLHEVLAAVAKGELTEAIVPLENSSEGAVNQTQDLLAHNFPDLCIKGEIILPIVHHLLAPPGVKLEQIERVLSHPQALAQCREFIQKNLPLAQVVETASTAAAVHLVASTGAPWAAIGPLTAVRGSGLKVLVENINDCPGNATRFVAVGKEDAVPGPACKTSLIISLSDHPGALYEVLGEFARRGINLTRIESRPSRRRLGEYLFFLDLEGHRQDKPVQEALKAVSARAEIRVLGSYPVVTSNPAVARENGSQPFPGSTSNKDKGLQSGAIEEIRLTIDAVDAQIVELLARRARLVARVGELKHGICPVRDLHRESRVLARVRHLAALQGVDPEMVEKVYRLLIQYAVRIQKQQHCGRGCLS